MSVVADDMCYCGQPLHYAQARHRAAMDQIVALKGRYIPVETPDGVFLVCRHYIALHGVRGRDVTKLGFVKEPA